MLENQEVLDKTITNFKPEIIVHLAAQAGVRYSIENPMAYIDSNIVGFANILEGCRHHDIKHLVYASSSSVYGANTSMPFSVHDNVDHPLSHYAASKKSNSSSFSSPFLGSTKLILTCSFSSSKPRILALVSSGNSSLNKFSA